jgi:hypothetical protein
VQDAEIRKARTVVPGDRTHNLSITPGHELVRHFLANRLSLRDREQMLLTFSSGIGNQGPAIESLGLTKDGTGDVNRIVKSQFFDDLDRGIVGTSQSPRELDASRCFNILLQPAYYLSEHPDFVVGIPAHDQ